MIKKYYIVIQCSCDGIDFSDEIILYENTYFFFFNSALRFLLNECGKITYKGFNKLVYVNDYTYNIINCSDGFIRYIFKIKKVI